MNVERRVAELEAKMGGQDERHTMFVTFTPGMGDAPPVIGYEQDGRCWMICGGETVAQLRERAASEARRGVGGLVVLLECYGGPESSTKTNRSGTAQVSSLGSLPAFSTASRAARSH